jgi:hypothetical protein
MWITFVHLAFLYFSSSVASFERFWDAISSFSSSWP